MYNILKDKQAPVVLLGVWQPDPGPDPQDPEMCLTLLEGSSSCFTCFWLNSMYFYGVGRVACLSAHLVSCGYSVKAKF